MIRLAAVLALSAMSLTIAGSASAIQFTLAGTERLHTSSSGEGGAQWNTGGLNNGGQIVYDSGTEILSVTAALNTLNYWDSTNGSCSLDVGTNCQFNYPTDLAMTIEMSLESITLTPFVGPGFDTIVTVAFETTADGNPDYTLVDPTDNTTLLEADWAAGTFQGTPTPGVTASILYNTGTGVASFGSGQVADTGFLVIDQSTPYASLVQSGINEYFAVNFTTLDDFDDGAAGGLNEIIAAAVNTGSLPDFTAEAQGQIYRVEQGGFEVPEPATGALFLLGFIGLVKFNRRIQN